MIAQEQKLAYRWWRADGEEEIREHHRKALIDHARLQIPHLIDQGFREGELSVEVLNSKDFDISEGTTAYRGYWQVEFKDIEL